MLLPEIKKKLTGKYEWDTAQQKANFNKNMRKNLKKSIRDLSDLVLIMKSLPPQVLENADR
jgi:hypothetical protein